LLDSGVPSIRLTNRSPDKTHELVATFGPQVIAVDWTERHTALDGANLLVNTTNLGMQGQPALDLDLSALSPRALVSDVIYAPLETPLLAAARLRGNATVNGLGMLLNQARPAFEAWFGVMPALSQPLLDKVNASF
jgi:shikimate dehydrogenase